MTIVEQELFKVDGNNHVCFICNNLLWAMVSKFAYENNIPFVASGLDLAQLSSGRSTLLEPSKIANHVAEKSTRLMFVNAINNMEKSKLYCCDPEYRQFIDTLKQTYNKTNTIYLYIYHNFSLNYLKDKLFQMNWTPPGNTDHTTYISSGCRIIFEVLGELEKLDILTLNEKEQEKWMVEKGLMESNMLNEEEGEDLRGTVDLSGQLMEELK